MLCIQYTYYILYGLLLIHASWRISTNDANMNITVSDELL